MPGLNAATDADGARGAPARAGAPPYHRPPAPNTQHPTPPPRPQPPLPPPRPAAARDGAMADPPAPDSEAARKEAALTDYRRKLLAHAEADARARGLREAVRGLRAQYDRTEDDLKALQSVGQIIGEVLRQLDDERCERSGGREGGRWAGGRPRAARASRAARACRPRSLRSPLNP